METCKKKKSGDGDTGQGSDSSGQRTRGKRQREKLREVGTGGAFPDEGARSQPSLKQGNREIEI
jgi:hypothetical protein